LYGQRTESAHVEQIKLDILVALHHFLSASPTTPAM
jgi:hypothetical protein